MGPLTLADVLAKEGITETAFGLMTPEAQQQIIGGAAVKYPEFDMNTGIDIGNITNTTGNIGGDAISGSWIPGLSNMDALRGGLGIGQLGLGVLSYLDQSKTAGKERKLLDQQIDQNKFLISQAKQRQGDITKAFGGGLAAKSANRVV